MQQSLFLFHPRTLESVCCKCTNRADRGDPPYTDPNRGFISLSVSDTENTSQDEKGVIHGVTGSDIKFDINFNGTIAADAPNRNAIVRVEYHNYTCEHLIFVHQGNRPQEVVIRQAGMACVESGQQE